ncbi:MAG: DUF3857 domain-containing protein [Phycisphaerae bacterium]|nr:DUF3857 domain-containing protein [Phycisphaerae bacterium]
MTNCTKRPRMVLGGMVRGGGVVGRSLATLIGVLAVVAVLGVAVSDAWAQDDKTAVPNMKLGAAEFPGEDAIILRWEQYFTLEKDGTVRRRDHKWLKLLTPRPIRAVADPRIDYCVGQDELKIRTAQTILPDGTVLPVPDYSFNKAGPDDVAGWPEYTNWEQMVICFSGIVNDCVLELDYEIVTKPGVIPWLEADLRVIQDYPTAQRVVSITVPVGTELRYRSDNLSPAPRPEITSAADGKTTYRLSFENVAGAPGEPQSLPWQKRCGRLRFTTCPRAADWVSALVKRVDGAARAHAAIKKFVEAAAEKETDPLERVRKVAKKLRDSFNFVDSAKTMRSFECRSAAEVLHSNYGNPLEAAALLAAALRSLGMKTVIEVAVDADVWNDAVPTSTAFTEMVVLVDIDGDVVHLRPQHGEFRNPGEWGRHWLLGLDESGKLRKTYVYARGEKEPSEIQIDGKVTVDADGKAAGDLRFRLTGAFYDPTKLETSGQQENLIKDVVGRVLSEFDVKSHSITMLSDEMLKATAKVTSNGKLQNHGKRNLLQLGGGPAFLPTFPVPLGCSYRKTDVQMSGQIRENVDLVVELPEEWGAAVVPVSLPRTSGKWGTAEQTVAVDGQTVHLHRTIATNTDTIASDDFAAIREAVNSLRTEAARMLVVGPREGPAEKPSEEPAEKTATAGGVSNEGGESATEAADDIGEETRTRTTDLIYARIRIEMEKAITKRAALLKAGTAPSDPQIRKLEGIILRARDLLAQAGEVVADVEPPIAEPAS